MDAQKRLYKSRFGHYSVFKNAELLKEMEKMFTGEEFLPLIKNILKHKELERFVDHDLTFCQGISCEYTIQCMGQKPKSRLFVALKTISRKVPTKITWNDILQSLEEIERLDVIRELFEVKHKEKWESLLYRNSSSSEDDAFDETAESVDRKEQDLPSMDSGVDCSSNASRERMSSHDLRSVSDESNSPPSSYQTHLISPPNPNALTSLPVTVSGNDPGDAPPSRIQHIERCVSFCASSLDAYQKASNNNTEKAVSNHSSPPTIEENQIDSFSNSLPSENSKISLLKIIELTHKYPDFTFWFSFLSVGVLLAIYGYRYHRFW